MMRKFYLFLIFLFGLNGAFGQTGNMVIPTGHAFKIFNVYPDKQLKYLYTHALGKTIMWDLKTHEQLYTLDGNIEGISNDGTKIILNGGCVSTITGKKLCNVNGFVAFSADDKQLFFVKNGFNVLDIADQKVTKLIPGSIDISWDVKGCNLIDSTHLVIRYNKGWKVWSTITKALEFEYNFTGDNDRSFYFPSIKCFIAVYIAVLL